MVHLFGHEGDEGRGELGDGDQALVEGGVGGGLVGVVLALPEAAAAAADVPVREVVDELLDGAAGAGGVVAVEAGVDLDDELLELGEDPAVEGGARGQGDGGEDDGIDGEGGG